LLLKRVQRARMPSYPATLALYVAGRIDEQTLEDSWIPYVGRGARTVSCKWSTEFYRSFLALRGTRISRAEFRTGLASQVGDCNAGSLDLKDFIQVTSQVEFYIARYEARCSD
jgi:hypothetical protein